MLKPDRFFVACLFRLRADCVRVVQPIGEVMKAFCILKERFSVKRGVTGGARDSLSRKSLEKDVSRHIAEGFREVFKDNKVISVPGSPGSYGQGNNTVFPFQQGAQVCCIRLTDGRLRVQAGELREKEGGLKPKEEPRGEAHTGL